MTISSASRGPAEGRRGDAGPARPTTPEVEAAPRLLKLPLLGGLTRPVRLLGLAAGSAMILFLGALQPRLYPDLPIAVLYVAPVVLVAWVGGTVPGVIAAAAASAARMIVDDVTGVRPSDPSVPFWNFGISLTLYVTLAWVLARLHSTLLAERELARTDALTMLGNRRFFEHFAAVELFRSQRYGRAFALAYVDLDHFKEVNDALGHATGDRVLQQTAAVLVHALRSTDLVARLGGDEFAVVLPETSDEGAAVAMAKAHERLTAAMSAGGYPVTFSIGVVTYEAGPATLAELLDTADRVMYAVKRGGRGQISVQRFGDVLVGQA